MSFLHSNPVIPFAEADKMSDRDQADVEQVNTILSHMTQEQLPAAPFTQHVTATASIEYPGLTVFDTYFLQAVRALFEHGYAVTSDDTLLERAKKLTEKMLAYRKERLEVQ